MQSFAKVPPTLPACHHVSRALRGVLSLESPDAVRLAVRNVHLSRLAHEDAMRPRKLALARLAIRSVAPLAGAHDGGDNARFQIDSADRVALRVGQIQAAVWRPGNSFRPRELGGFGGTAVALVAGLTRAPHVEDAVARRILPKNAVAFPSY